MQLPEPPGPRTLTALAERQRPVEIALEQHRLRDLSPERPSALDVFDRRASYLGEGELAEVQVGDPSKGGPEPQERRGVRRRVDHKVQHPALGVECRKQHPGTNVRRDPQDVRYAELELGPLELDLRSPRLGDRVAGVGRPSEPVVHETQQCLADRAVVGLERHGAFAQRQAVARRRSEGDQGARVQVALASRLHDQNDTHNL